MKANEHPPVARLRRLLAGELETAQAETVLAHLEGCEVCLELAEGVWAETSPLVAETPTLDRERSRAIESAILWRIRRVALVEDAVTLGSRGFVHVVLGLLRPLLALVPGRDEGRRS